MRMEKHNSENLYRIMKGLSNLNEMMVEFSIRIVMLYLRTFNFIIYSTKMTNANNEV
jgi:hypothetical protein